MKILLFSSLYPNAEQPSHGIFVENRLRNLLQYRPDLDVRVVAPVPWFPVDHPLFGGYAGYARVPRHEFRHGIEVYHPRYLVIPRLGMRLTPLTLASSARAEVSRLIADGFDFDLIDAHYFYPDGVAAAALARRFGRPFVVTGRGTDLNLIPRYRGPRAGILRAANEAAHLVTVAAALKQYLLDMGVEDSKVTVLRNGVDLAFFRAAQDRPGLRAALGFSERPTLLSVGHLIERKGHHLVIDALDRLPGYELVIAGDGEQMAALRERVRASGLGSRVRFVGRLDQDALRQHYQAADALVLASSREGWANVLLESMACGTPVVATPVDGTPEVVAAPEAGLLTRDRSASAIADAVRDLFADLPERASTRRYAEGFSWDETSRGQLEIFERALRRRALG